MFAEDNERESKRTSRRRRSEERRAKREAEREQRRLARQKRKSAKQSAAEKRVPEAQKINSVIVKLMRAGDDLASAASAIKDPKAKELASGLSQYSKMLAGKVKQAGLGRA